MSTWTDEQEAEYQTITRRARELETQRGAILRDREQGVVNVAVKVFTDAGFKTGDMFDLSGAPPLLAEAMRKNAAAVRAALVPYDGSNAA